MPETEGALSQERPTHSIQEGQQVQYSQPRVGCPEAGIKDDEVIKEIDWDGDPENPRNWHLFRRCYNTLVPALLNFAVYVTSPYLLLYHIDIDTSG